MRTRTVDEAIDCAGDVCSPLAFKNRNLSATAGVVFSAPSLMRNNIFK